MNMGPKIVSNLVQILLAPLQTCRFIRPYFVIPDKVVHWDTTGLDYTFIFFALKKDKPYIQIFYVVLSPKTRILGQTLSCEMWFK
jgi:hypothetical protein